MFCEVVQHIWVQNQPKKGMLGKKRRRSLSMKVKCVQSNNDDGDEVWWRGRTDLAMLIVDNRLSNVDRNGMNEARVKWGLFL